jgi:hypothetical protein
MDDERFLSNPYVYNQLVMTKRVPHVTFVLSTFEWDVNASLENPFFENVPDTLFIFRNKDVETTTYEDW